ncbi:hypothetical protein Q31a_56330 [Aureliella helgolandensis]|uniref:Uncharacterized protein n=2 Tax=Aureliella helgolandensis TaxID=2527968 RepID=A0A518GF72_9BACT|nr:hypothetical protein Q31a_56330 [Aureliella helgolandensis]
MLAKLIQTVRPSAVTVIFLAIATGSSGLSLATHARELGEIEIGIVEDQTGESLVTRVQLLDSKGRAMRIKGARFARGWNLVEGPLLYRGRAGNYRYQVFHGPQFSAGNGGFTLHDDGAGSDTLRLQRHANIADEGWRGADLLARGVPDLVRPWLAAEDLDLAVIVDEQTAAEQEVPDAESFVLQPTASPADAAWVEHGSYHDTRPGSGLVLHHWLPPAEVPVDLPSSRLLVMSKQSVVPAGGLPVHNEIQRLWARDVPVWLASGHVDSIQILSEHLTRDGTDATKFTPYLEPDPGRFRGPRGPGRLIEYLYWQVLETGLRIPPSAGSGYGKGNSPLGYNRVYANTPHLSPNYWWLALKAGNSFVTNGPLLRARVNGYDAGSILTVPRGQAEFHLDVTLTLTTSDPVEYLDVIFNGKTLYQARLDEYAKQGGVIPPLQVTESGWAVVRVVTEREHTYRLASTAPFYIEFDGRARISRSAVRFFQDWLAKATKELASDAESAAAAAPYLAAADMFWTQRLSEATAD